MLEIIREEIEMNRNHIVIIRKSTVFLHVHCRRLCVI